jgi:hypothetical protein
MLNFHYHFHKKNNQYEQVNLNQQYVYFKILMAVGVKVFLSLMVCLIFMSPATQAKNTMESYRQMLSGKYPEYSSDLKRLLEEYPYWVITLEEEYGLPPLLAMLKTSEDQFALLFRNPALFNDIYQAIPEQINRKGQRAKYALLLANAMSLSEPDESYLNAFKQAKFQDQRQIHTSNSQSAVQRFLQQYPQPRNYFEILKQDPQQFNLFLDLIQNMDHRLIALFIDYPNAGEFLLQTGLEGYDLLMEYGEEILFLSIFLDPVDQKRLPDLFRHYQELGLVVEELGLEGFLSFLALPDFYSKFIRKFSADRRNGVLLAYEYVQVALEHLGSDQFDRMVTGPDQDYLVDALTDIARRETKDGSPAYLSLLNDPYVTEFVLAHRNQAVELVGQFGNLNVAEMITQHWNFSYKSREAAIQAINQFGFMGVQALYRFSRDKTIKEAVAEYGVKALMVFHYKSPGEYRRIFSDGHDSLAEYELEPMTGYPLHVKSSVVEFVPGHDLVKNAYFAVKHQRLPTFGEVVFMGVDVADIALYFIPFIPPGAGKAAIQWAKSASLTASKVGRKSVSKPLKSNRQKIEQGMDQILPHKNYNANTAKKNSLNRKVGAESRDVLQSIRKSTAKIDYNLNENYWLLKARSYIPDQNLDQLINRTSKWLKKAGVNPVDIPKSNHPDLKIFSPRVVLLKHLKAELALTTLCYVGASALNRNINNRMTTELQKSGV